MNLFLCAVASLQLVAPSWATSEVTHDGSNLRGSSVTMSYKDDDLAEQPLAGEHRNLVGTDLQNAETILPSGGSIAWTIDGVVHVSLCGASTANPMKASWVGTEATGGSGAIRWDSVKIEPHPGNTGPTCNHSRDTAGADFTNNFLGADCGVMPAYIALPTHANMKKFTIANKEVSLCAGTGNAVTSWYGKPCASDATQIEWQHMESTATGPNAVLGCVGTPQWKRGYGGAVGDDHWFGHCGTSAHWAPLPLKVDYVTYKTAHQLSELCAASNVDTESIWIGESCASGGCSWQKVTSPM